MKILITDQVEERCREILQAEGFEVEFRPGITPDEIKKALATATALIVRSQTKVSADILEAGTSLKVVGRAGAGVDNIDVDAATRRGVIVMNTPGGNTISTAEHTISMMMALARNIPQAHQSLRDGKWERKKFTGTELHGKTLGIVGLGKVGAEVAKRCLAFEMIVIAYDPLLSSEASGKLGVELVELSEIFRRSDFLTIHSPLTAETRHLIDERILAQCKPGVRIINCARG
ncbi:MAG TPA: hydroxyacid dehydrogenase, partial [Bacteroidota bacterium]|nr:hydroxyacid dehydrogenase [Bacteroidota bacterium]